MSLCHTWIFFFFFLMNPRFFVLCFTRIDSGPSFLEPSLRHFSSPYSSQPETQNCKTLIVLLSPRTSPLWQQWTNYCFSTSSPNLPSSLPLRSTSDSPLFLSHIPRERFGPGNETVSLPRAPIQLFTLSVDRFPPKCKPNYLYSSSSLIFSSRRPSRTRAL